MEQRLDDASRQIGISSTQCIIEALNEYLEDLEDEGIPTSACKASERASQRRIDPKM
jgi:predicted DNA-binding protein